MDAASTDICPTWTTNLQQTGRILLRSLSKVRLWPHPLFTKPETPQWLYVTICTEFNHGSSSNAESTDRSSFRVLSKARLSVSRFPRNLRLFSTFLSTTPIPNKKKIRQTAWSLVTCNRQTDACGHHIRRSCFNFTEGLIMSGSWPLQIGPLADGLAVWHPPTTYLAADD
jgi:hypothetical protein